MCNYFNETGIYSMRSYSLSPADHKERVGICRGTAGRRRVAVPPYAGPCRRRERQPSSRRDQEQNTRGTFACAGTMRRCGVRPAISTSLVGSHLELAALLDPITNAPGPPITQSP